MNQDINHTTTAEEVSALLSDDGQVWYSLEAGDTVHGLATSRGANYTNFGKGFPGGPAESYTFPDGSKLISRESGWGIGFRGTGLDCLCWRQAGHVDGCPYAGTAS